MPQETPTGDFPPQESPAANGGAKAGGVEAFTTLLHGDSPDLLRGGVSGSADPGSAGEDETERPEGAGGGEQRADQQPPQSNGAKVRPPGDGASRTIEVWEIVRACNAAIDAGGRPGFKRRAADLLGRDTDWLVTRIKGNTQLNALFGQVNTLEGAQPPTEGEVLVRDSKHLPLVPPAAMDLFEMVTDAEKKIHYAGLKKTGLSESLIKKIKSLEGLASSTGHFLAQSLEVLARSYYVQTLEMIEVASDLRAKLMAKSGEEGYVASDEARAFFNRNYAEMVKETGRAFELMLSAIQAMVKMTAAGKGDEDPNTPTRKAGWKRGAPAANKIKEGAPSA